MDLGCMAQYAFQRNWFPDPIAGLFSYQSWNGMDGFWQVARLFNLDAFKPIEAIIQSMTPKERANPDLIAGNRRKRIAAGSGTSVQQVNGLLKQFEDMRKMTKKMNKMQGSKKGIADMFGGMGM